MIEFKLGGIRIGLHFSFFAIIALLTLLKNVRYTAYGLYACILHEFGHLIWMQALSVRCEQLLFYAAGIRITVRNERFLPLWKDLLILSGGCMLNFFTCALFIFLSNGNTEMLVFAYTNLMIGVFNLIPIRCFDGGRIGERLIEQFCPVDKIPVAKRGLKFLCVGILLTVLFVCYINKSNNITLYVTLLYFLFSSMLF